MNEQQRRTLDKLDADYAGLKYQYEDCLNAEDRLHCRMGDIEYQIREILLDIRDETQQGDTQN